MNNDRITSLLLHTLEVLGVELWENRVAEDLRTNIKLIDLFVGLNHLVHDDRGLSANDLENRAPTLLKVYRDVMLRDIEEYIPRGNESRPTY